MITIWLFGRWAGHATRHDKTNCALEVMVSGAHDKMTEIKIVANVIYTKEIFGVCETLYKYSLATSALARRDCARTQTHTRTMDNGLFFFFFLEPIT